MIYSIEKMLLVSELTILYELTKYTKCPGGETPSKSYGLCVGSGRDTSSTVVDFRSYVVLSLASVSRAGEFPDTFTFDSRSLFNVDRLILITMEITNIILIVTCNPIIGRVILFFIYQVYICVCVCICVRVCICVYACVSYNEFN